MSLLGMPWTVINLGCEMIYILDQRLKAQNIPADKSWKVVADVVKTMFDMSFVNDKLFVPQEMYSMASTRKIFDRLAHSSIMRLNESSMDKLFDLMVMGAKYQLLCCTKPDDILQVMLRHLAGVKGLLASAASAVPEANLALSEACALVTHAEEAALLFYASMAPGEVALLRHTLCRFFQDKRVKVSLFLAEGIQGPGGRMILPGCLANDVGLVRSFDMSGKVEYEERLTLGSQLVDKNEFFCHPVPLGDNLYNKERPKVVPPPRKADQTSKEQQGTAAAAAAPAAAPPQAAAAKKSGPALYAEEMLEQTGPNSTGKRELDLLAALIKPSTVPKQNDNFKLNLFQLSMFGNEGEEDGLSTAPAAGHKAPKQGVELMFGGDKSSRGAGELGRVMQEMELGGGGGADMDLLELMDSAGS